MEVIDKRKDGYFDKIKNTAAWKKISKIKNIRILAAVFIIAVGLIIYSTVIGNVNQNKQITGVSNTTVMDAEEQKLASILGGIEGAGKVETLITRKGDDIVGVLIIAEGADNISVRFKLIDAATTALNVDKKIVDVYKKK